MPGHLRRHSVHLSDREVLVFERAVRLYLHAVSIVGSQRHDVEARDAERIATVLDAHFQCSCPVPPESPASEGSPV